MPIWPDMERVGERYEPSNGTEGACFHEAWCCNCERDKEMNGTCYQEGRDAGDGDWCEILGASFRGEAKEWIFDDKGMPSCTAFVLLGTQEPTPRCPHTMELPL
jgi:hypothetical protein